MQKGRNWETSDIEWYKRNGMPFGLRTAKTEQGWIQIYKKIERKLSDPDYKRVARTRLWWGGCVSTIWLGLDHGFGNSKPMIFESMLFGGEDNNSLQRYSTEHEALKGHKEMVKEYNGLRYGVSQVYYKIKQKLINLFKQES